MASKMDLIVAGPDRHVLAAAIRHNQGSGPPAIVDLVGTGLRLRDGSSGDILVSIPPEQLALAEADLRDDVLLTARQFVMAENLPEEGIAPAASQVQLNGSQITASVPAAITVTANANVWAYIEGGPQPIVHRLTIDKSMTTASEPLHLPAGQYRVLVLATGVRAALVNETVP
jgi:hypothetical protein